MFRLWDGVRRLTYFLDKFVGRFKRAASELVFQCIAEKEVKKRKIG
jgi:hypothetical protein